MHAKKLTLGLALALGLAGCKSNPPAAPATIVDMNNGPDPAAANLAPADPNAQPAQPSGYSAASAPAQPASQGRVLGQRSQYPQSAPTTEQYPYPNESTYAPTNDDAYNQQVDAGQDALYADQAPPPLPVYDQPQLTQANDLWTPGYWNYNTAGYYFVPGAWVAPPYDGALWTPGYWGYEGRRYRFHRGFWGRHIGFYGGIDYGFGYFGTGYEGGYWNNNNFYYNQRVNRMNTVDIHNVYVRNVVVENDRHFSYNGPGGYQARPGAAELAVYHEQRLPPMQAQIKVREQAAGNRQQFFSENHGRPAVFATPQRIDRDQQPPRPIEPVQRGGFGHPGGTNAQQQQLRTQQNQQRTQQNEQRTQQNEQHTAQQQQHNTQVQQQEQQRQQQLQQRNVQQQHAQQLQQRSQQQSNTQQQQRVEAQQQHNAAAQQQNQQRQQQVQVRQQRTQQDAQAQQQRAQQEQQRGQQEQQRQQQEQQHAAQPQQRQAAPQMQPQRAAPAPRPQPAPQPQRPAPAPQQHTEAPHEGGGHPRH